MLTIIAQLKVKEEMLDEYLEMASMLTAETVGKRKGCISYSFNQSLEEPTEFVLYEQWESEEDLTSHIEYLKVLLGPVKPGGFLPEKLMNMYESGQPYYYKVIE
ncbi:putative quinol monooxygenase [Vibrio gazogenes]|uniref:Antibiotic biosynthesis monooxygenase n=1 Tax=Vibrio gazogenes DSM 21264 = NBRC 103151 TaxID=1123492 RepID=A0A1M4TJE7_VIBGA|nr:antibiotic biosynthesis monooxygenase family protein [Vibrio gazogenes]USP16113.1 antibiotic biosynthesis monooxygenase [Vibrio gazogenes]SHE44601.1 Antibiotic biosynthesis monooxygenase [Vibrio gazogenes DSM 21264] [Vibrio gazogenes DSM 21264 = NBRC 103151]SJN54193.1 Antibiotic biosynthesis monooxygenase [Vibrio gazogenes]